MLKRMLALLVIAFLMFIPVSDALSVDTSVENAGNSLPAKTLGQSVADQITVVDNTAGGGDYTVVPDETDPDKIHIVGGDTGGHTVNSEGDVDLEITLPEGTYMIICVRGFKVISSYDLELTYTPPGGSEKTVSRSLSPYLGDQYYYPEGNKLKLVPMSGDYRDHLFQSAGPVVLKILGNDVGITPLDVSIIVG